MSEVWVLNASPIITLAKIAQLPLLDRLASELLVPEAVASETLAGPATDPARLAISEATNLVVNDVGDFHSSVGRSESGGRKRSRPGSAVTIAPVSRTGPYRLKT